MRRIFLWLTLVLGLMTAPAWAFFSLLGFQNSMIEFLIEQLSTEGELEITVDEVVESEDGASVLRGLSIADSEGVWFTAATLDFAWNPTRLLRGEVEFSRLSMDGVRVIRPPIVPESETEPEPTDPDAPLIPKIAWPRSPLTMRIEGLALTDVQIAEPLLGHALAFDANGSAQDEGDIQSVMLDLVRTDTVAGEISLAYARDFSDNTLKVTLEAQESAGGLITALSGLPDDAASNITLSADGPPEAWRTELALDLANTITMSGEAVIAYQGPLQVDASLQARPGPQLDPQLAALLGTEADLIARVKEGADGVIEISEGRIDSPDLKLTASGTYARPTGAADLEIDLDAGAALAGPIEGVEFGGLTFKGRVQGAPGDIAADGDLVLAGLATAPVDLERAELNVDVRQSNSDGQTTTALEVTGLTRGLRLDKIGADVIGDADTEILAELTGDSLTLDQFWLHSNVLRLTLSGNADLATQDAELGFGLASPDLSPVARAYGVEAHGAIDTAGMLTRAGGVTELSVTTELSEFAHAFADAQALSLTSDLRLQEDTLAFDLTGQGVQMRIDRIGADLLPESTFEAKGTLTGDQLELEGAVLRSPLADLGLSGDLHLTERRGALRYQLETAELAPLAALYDQPARGALSATGTATLTGDDAPPRVAGDLGLAGLVWDGARYGRLDVRHDVEASPTANGTISVSNEGGPFGSVAVSTRFALDQPSLTLEDLDARALGLRATGAVKANLDGPLAEGQLAFRANDLSALRRVTGADLAGRAEGSILLSTPGGRQNAKLALTATGVRTGGLTVQTARINAALSNLLGSPGVDANVTAKDVATGGLTLADVTTQVKGPLSRLDFKTAVAGQLDGKTVRADASGRADVSTPTVRATIAQAEAALDSLEVSLNAPLRITSRGGTVTLKGLDLALPAGGNLAGDVTSHGGPISGGITLAMPDLTFLKEFADIPLARGGLDAMLDFDTRRRRASGTANGRDVVFEGIDATGALTLDSELNWQGRAADVRATVSGDFGDPLMVTASLPVSGGSIPGLANKGPVSAAITWAGEIGDLWALVPAPGHVLSGQTKIDLGVSGDIAQPQITGGIAVTEGSYQNLDAGTILTDLEITTSLSAGGDLALSVKGSDGAAGTVVTEGTVALDASGIDLTTTIDQAVLVRRDDVLARLDGQIAVKGPVSALNVTGEITLDEAEVRLVNANPPGIVTLGDVLIKGEPEPEVKEDTSSVTLALDVNAPGRLFVRGRGLDSEWQLGLKIRGDAASPRITGRIERVRGRLDLIGKAFDMARGRIDFDGGKKIDPRIEIVLERETSDLTGRIVVDGLSSDPQLAFTSTPSLPEDEVLPRTIFGKSSQALTGSQAIQLALGLATLMDGGGGTLDSVRGAVGLDSLNVEQDADGNASVAAGKQVTEDIWVGTKQSLGGGGDSGGGTSVVVEIDILEDFQIESEVEAGGDSSIGLQWKKDF